MEHLTRQASRRLVSLDVKEQRLFSKLFLGHSNTDPASHPVLEGAQTRPHHVGNSFRLLASRISFFFCHDQELMTKT